MPPLVRRRPLAERIKAYLSPIDLWIWVLEEIETSDYQLEEWVTPFALLLNLLMVIGRANSVQRVDDDIFGDETQSSFTTWIVS